MRKIKIRGPWWVATGQDFEGPAPLPSRPTDYLPGTVGKVRILQGRAWRGEQLFHPDDAVIPEVRDNDGAPVPSGVRKASRMIGRSGGEHDPAVGYRKWLEWLNRR